MIKIDIYKVLYTTVITASIIVGSVSYGIGIGYVTAHQKGAEAMSLMIVELCTRGTVLFTKDKVAHYCAPAVKL